MKTIKIQIVSEAHCGKTTLAAFLSKTLAEKGFNVKVIDDGPPILDAKMKNNLEILNNKVNIEIKTVQAPRNSL